MFRTLKRAIGPLAIALAASTTSAFAQAPTPYGVWLDESGKGAIEISDCSGRLCGKVVWVRDAKDKAGCNFQILGDVRPVGPNRWDNGWIIDPDRSTTQRYDLELTLLNANRLRVTGYAGVKFLSETVTWTRAQPGLQRCTEAAAAPQPAPGPVASAPAPDATAPAVPVAPASPGAPPSPAPTPAPQVQAEAPSVATPAPVPVPVPQAEPAPRGKVARGGPKQCTFDVPYVGKITVPCE